jgi:hypothetical protein
MKDFFHIKAAAGMIVVLFVGSFLGNRIDTAKDNETFYRWLVSAASLSRIGETLEPESTATSDEPMDDEIFADVILQSNAFLAHIEPQDEETDYDKNGNPYPKLMLATRQAADQDIWEFAISSEQEELKQSFLAYYRNGQILSAGTQFDTASLYNKETQAQGVGLTSLFLGFRKLSANFMWLQVDKFYHEGQLHRMVPLMRACVTLDPTFIDAYLLGSWHMAYNITAKLPETPEHKKVLHPQYKKRLGLKEEWYYRGVEFLKDGIYKNPRDYRLYFDLGYGIFETKLEDHANAVKYLDEATRYRHDQWVPRMLYRSLYLNGDYEKAIDGWADYLSPDKFPDNVAGQRFIQINRAELSEAIADDARYCRDEAQKALEFYQSQNDQAKAEDAVKYIEELNELIQEETLKAERIWNKLVLETQDSIAMAKMSRRKALNLVDEKKPYEAIAELDFARWEWLNFFLEANDLMIKIKQDFDIPLTISEQLQLEREKEAEKYLDESDIIPKVRRVDCRIVLPSDAPI